MISLYNAAAKGYSKAINDLNKQSKPKVETEKTNGLLTRSMTRMPKQEEGSNKEPYDMVLDAMKQIREYRSRL
tara:strand:- start:188 stop:406 length:219 start_codon:yes stop_codon:yes gene_type:complete